MNKKARSKQGEPQMNSPSVPSKLFTSNQLTDKGRDIESFLNNSLVFKNFVLLKKKRTLMHYVVEAGVWEK